MTRSAANGKLPCAPARWNVGPSLPARVPKGIDFLSIRGDYMEFFLLFAVAAVAAFMIVS